MLSLSQRYPRRLLLAAAITCLCLASCTTLELPQANLDIIPTQTVTAALATATPTELDGSATITENGAATPGQYLDSISYTVEQAKYYDVIDTEFRLTPAERAMLEQNGFVISDRLAFTDFRNAYGYIYWRDLPVLVTTDSILHSIHQTYSQFLVDVETYVLRPRLATFLIATLQEVERKATVESNPRLLAIYDDLQTYLAVPIVLLGEEIEAKYTISSVPEYVEKVTAASVIDDVGLFGSERPVDFTLFTPRAHYTSSDILASYFRAVSWLAHVDFRWVEYSPQGEPLLNPDHIAATALLHDVIVDAN